ncbi:MAG: Glu/Leu/Phe/Val dehydrogenase [Deltaproteobacteria bacterium]|nr:MAG: Glu/Leu/Phe/Val dehydrogenase [Deltaproteobacteria bacterium]
MGRILDLSPDAFARALREADPPRGHLVYRRDEARVEASHPMLDELAGWLCTESRDFRQHEAIFLAVGPETGALFGAFLYRTLRGQAQGGLRRWGYATVEDWLRDGLRLSVAMGRKNALAGLWWGGGKGLIADPADGRAADAGFRRTLYREYGAFVSSLRGCYVTAEDVGTTPDDVAQVFRRTRFVTCIPPAFGGSGNPSPATAAGVVCAMEAALAFQGAGELGGKRVAMQGAGQVGAAMIEMLLAKGVATVVASEISPERCGRLRETFAHRAVEVREVPPGDVGILAEPCDVLAPNALGGVIGPATIPTLQTRLVCGASNNPLVDEDRDDKALADRGILYVPDFVCNRMGIVSCANEAYGNLPDDPDVLRHLRRDAEGSIWRTTGRILEHARAQGITPVAAANQLADRLVEERHPIWGERTRAIIESLLAGDRRTPGA